MTPTTVRVRPCTWTCRPITEGSPPNVRRQSSFERTTTGSTFGRSCSSVNVWPSAGRTPSTENMFAVTKAAFTRSGWSPSLTFIAPVV